MPVLPAVHLHELEAADGGHLRPRAGHAVLDVFGAAARPAGRHQVHTVTADVARYRGFSTCCIGQPTGAGTVAE